MPIFRIPALVRLCFPGRIWNIPSEKSVYLSFDDGPDPEITPWVLDQLKKFDFNATFFCVGENAARYPEILNRILKEGHRLGNHTMHHELGRQTEVDTYIQSVDEASGYIVSDLFRPPYGRLTRRQEKRLSEKYRIMMWTWISRDYDPNIPVSTILKRAQKELRPGDIIVLHDNPKTSERLKTLLPEFLSLIQEKGWTSKCIH